MISASRNSAFRISAFKRHAWLGVVFGTIAMSGGCSRTRAPDYPVITGIVTYAGKPLAGGDIRLTCAADETVDASGAIDAAGRFRVVFKTPVRPLPFGQYDVAVASWREKPGEERPDGSFTKGVSAIPRMYRDRRTSGVSVNVSAGAMQSISIVLPDDRSAE